MRRLLGESLEDRHVLAARHPHVGDVVHPPRELLLHIGDVEEAAAIEETPLKLPE
ncbi:MAG: hypothetical protein IPO88_20975 [Nannocystis sp.]|nr:hypothetical protein [Nannocystis sp.]MBK9755926.1 hypothetical protein [Nannocystis sp.]